MTMSDADYCIEGYRSVIAYSAVSLTTDWQGAGVLCEYTGNAQRHRIL